MIRSGLKSYFLFYAGINLFVSFVLIMVSLAGIGVELLYPLAVIATLICYWLLRKSLKPNVLWINAGITLLTLILFSIAMVIHGGSTYGWFYNSLIPLAWPFGGLVLILSLISSMDAFYGMLFIFLLEETLLSLLLQYKVLFQQKTADGLRFRRPCRALLAFIMVLVLLGTADVYFYSRRPEARYGGHGFRYMNGFSSTDFTDYTVYREDSRSKLVRLDHRPELQISKKEDMPRMDGAEACYPVYAAMAKACYVGIEDIEKDFQKRVKKHEISSYGNGEIVTFTNTLNGFSRLVFKEVDLLFSARPSKEQMAEARDEQVELEITPIGQEAFVFFVEADNPIDNLTSDQVRSIYHGDIHNWKEVGGPDQEILAFQRPAGSGSQTMMEYFMGDLSLKSPKTYETVGAMEGVITNVAQYANEEGAMGYSFRYFVEELNQEKNVKILSIDGIRPSLSSIEDGSYPLTVDLCLISRKNDPNPNVQKMIDFALSPDGQEIIYQTGYGKAR